MPTQKLIIFSKNPVPGKVKTRLAATVGNEKALKVYRKLLEHTASIAKELKVEKVVYYSDEVEKQDAFSPHQFEKKVQQGGDLGQRMQKAFAEELADANQAIIIGCDCYELQTEHLEKAFKELEKNDVIIGPAKDGGYYLMGMKKLHPEFFQNKEWGSSSVFKATMQDVKNLNLKVTTLPELNDVDREEDLGSLRALIS